MKYIVYLTTLDNSFIKGKQRIYIGVHKTKDPEIFDGYLGCGCKINQPSSYMYPKTPFGMAVKKYGADKFKRITLYVYDTAKEAYDKERELVDEKFVSQDHTFNMCIDNIRYKHYRNLYQFDLNGVLKRKWDCMADAYDFYGIIEGKLQYAIYNKVSLLSSYWSMQKEIDINQYKDSSKIMYTYLYSLKGKCLQEFYQVKDLAIYLNVDIPSITEAIKKQTLICGKYYVSNRLLDEFIPKPRVQYAKDLFYLYKDTGEFIGRYQGKKVMKEIKLYSWKKIKNIMESGGWYKEFYLSLSPTDVIPKREPKTKMEVEVYDKWGNFIELVPSIKEVREKYNVPASRIKHIQQGNKYYKDWIFKYKHSK